MTLSSLFEALVIMAVVIMFTLLGVYFMDKPISDAGYSSRLTHTIKLNVRALLGTILILITLIVLAIVAYAGINYALNL